MSKEDIFNKFIYAWTNDNSGESFISAREVEIYSLSEAIKLAMEQFAKQESIAFAEWISKNKLVYDFASWTWLYDHKLYTTTELFTLYQNREK